MCVCVCVYWISNSAARRMQQVVVDRIDMKKKHRPIRSHTSHHDKLDNLKPCSILSVSSRIDGYNGHLMFCIISVLWCQICFLHIRVEMITREKETKREEETGREKVGWRSDSPWARGSFLILIRCSYRSIVFNNNYRMDWFFIQNRRKDRWN